jgi:hypothetical protein
MGGRFWVGMLATIIAVGIAVGILFLLIGAAAVAWGFFGAMVVFAALALGIAWIYDRRKQMEYD